MAGFYWNLSRNQPESLPLQDSFSELSLYASMLYEIIHIDNYLFCMS